MALWVWAMSLTVEGGRPATTVAAPRAGLRERSSIGAGRRVVVLAVHHVRVNGQTLTGGAEKHILTAISALLECGASVHVGYSGSSIYDELLSHHDPRRLTVERTDWLDEALSGDARFQLRTILERRRWLRASGADTVLAVQQAGGCSFAASLFAAKSLGLRVVASVRQMPPERQEVGGDWWLGIIPRPQIWRRKIAWRRRLVGSCCDAIIFNSRTVAESYQRELGWSACKALVIPNGETTIRRKRDYGAVRTIGVVGRVTRAKGADVMLDAFAQVAGGNPGLRLVYFGEGPLESELKGRAKALGVLARVEFRGYVSDRDAIYDEIDLFVQASLRESLSNSLIEAMARGLPCIATDVGGTREAVIDGETGLVVPPGESRAMADALSNLISDVEARLRFGDNGLRRVRREFNSESAAFELVRTVVGSDGRRGG
jgi:glycosyltransferase involved in cell wall biosynthesis